MSRRSPSWSPPRRPRERDGSSIEASRTRDAGGAGGGARSSSRRSNSRERGTDSRRDRRRSDSRSPPRRRAVSPSRSRSPPRRRFDDRSDDRARARDRDREPAVVLSRWDGSTAFAPAVTKPSAAGGAEPPTGAASGVSRNDHKRAHDFSSLIDTTAPAVPRSDGVAPWEAPDAGEIPGEQKVDPEKPNFGLSGALAKDRKHGNTFRGIVLKWREPDDACMPTKRWQLFVFKGPQEMSPPIRLDRQTAFLVGREEKIADILMQHESCSKQHAVIQFRLVEIPRPPEEMHLPVRKTVKPYVMDLQSSNGTYLNGKKIPDSRYVELKPEDVLKFGHSSREYVVMCSDAK